MFLLLLVMKKTSIETLLPQFVESLKALRGRVSFLSTSNFRNVRFLYLFSSTALRDRCENLLFVILTSHEYTQQCCADQLAITFT